jgi:protease-4
LTLDLSQGITDSNRTPAPSALLESVAGEANGRPITLRTVLEAIENAAKDDRIVGLYLHGSISPGTGGSGFATLREVRQALETFRESGKPILAYDDTQWKERDYYLVSAASTISINPSSLLEINGFSIEIPFFAGAFQKYGIGVQVLKVGRYKSGPEPYTRTSSSPEDRAQNQKLLADLWNEFVTMTAKSRNLTNQKIQAIANQQALLLPEQAKAAGLIDKIAYEDEVVAELRQLTGEKEDTTVIEATEEEPFRQISVAEYGEVVARDDQRSSENRVAVIYAEGDIVSGKGGPGTIGGDSLAHLLRRLRQDQDVKAIVLRVNSPGGGAAASEKVAREVFLTNQKKPVIVSMGSVAASGGYQISSYARRIFASPNTVTGSIGVYGILFNFQGIANNNGITWDGVKTGKFADGETISRPKTPEEIAIGQRVVNRIYDQFLTIVSQSRSINRKQIEAIAQGRVWSGVEAKKLRLVDEIGGLQEAIQAAAQAAKLGEDWQLDEYPEPGSLRELLGELFAAYSRPVNQDSDPLSLQVQKFQAELQRIRWMNDPSDMYSRLPFDPQID